MRWPFTQRREAPALLYQLHCGNLYGTERMALATLTALSEYRERIVLAPRAAQGDSVAAAARSAGLRSIQCDSQWQFVRALLPCLLRHRALDVISTGVKQSFIVHVLARMLRVRMRQLHVIHGGTNDTHAYGRKRHLNRLPVCVIAVSSFVLAKLVANGVRRDSIRVIDNFLPDEAVGASPPCRPSYAARPIDTARTRVAVVSRVDAIKRVDLLVDALAVGALSSFDFDVYGTGSELAALQRLGAGFANLRFHGFVPDVPLRLAQADLLLHLCPEEPFGLIFLEAFRGGVVSIAPDQGGACMVIDDGRTGFHFAANDTADLVRVLEKVRRLPEQELDRVADAATGALVGRFSAREGANHYRAALATQ